MKFGIEEKHLNSLIQYIKLNLGQTKNPKLYIYGSRVKGNFRPYSDSDLLLKANEDDEKSISQIDFNELDIPYKVDFTTENKLFEGYKDEIFQHMQEIKMF